MRIFKIILLAVILIVIVVFSVANRELVTLQLLPAGLSPLGQGSITVPLYAVGLLSILTGLILGYVLEWLREYKHRKRAARKSREAAALSREVGRLRKETGKGEDDVLTLLRN